MRAGIVHTRQSKYTLRALAASAAAMAAAMALVFGGAVASAAPAGADPAIPPDPPKAATAPAGVDAVQDGIWHVGEIGLWRDSSFTGFLYDTGADIIYSYTCCRFVNSSISVNDQVSSIANAQSGYRWTYEHAGYGGGSIIMLPYGQCNPYSCYAYSSLGWANDRLSSHAWY